MTYIEWLFWDFPNKYDLAFMGAGTALLFISFLLEVRDRIREAK